MADPYLEAIAQGIDPSWLRTPGTASAARSPGPPPPMPPVTVPGSPQFAATPVINVPTVDMSEPAPQGPPRPAAPVAPPPEPASRAPFPLRMTSQGGVVNIPAHETDLRGPSLHRAQETRNEAAAAAVDAVAERSQKTAAGDYAIALEQERQANIRADAAQYSAAERQAEMEQRQADFDMSVKAMSKQAADPKNFYSEPNVGSKVAALISAGLAGFVAGRTGRPGNVGLDVIKMWNEREARAQEMAFQLTRDTMQAKNTAFSMAMAKYNNVDAARAATRAALADASQAVVAQQAALWKSTEAQNHAQLLHAALEDEKMMQIAKGVAFTPAAQAQVGRKFVDENGIEYNERQAQEVAKDFRGQQHDINKIDRTTAGDILKNQGKAAEKADEGARHISQQLQTAGVPQARASAERALKALNVSEGGKLEAAVRWGLGDTISKAVLSDDANAREQAYNDFMAAAMKATYGNVTASEEVRSAKSYGSTGDPKARKRSIEAVLGTLSDLEKNAKSGASPEAQQEFDRRRQAAEGQPAAAPKGSKAGW